MQILRRLLFRNRSQSGQNQKIRGLSTAELVGIIVIVGVLGALGGTYVVGLVSAAKNNTGKQNAQNLQTVMTSALAGGAIVGTGTPANGNLDLTTSATAYAALTTGVTVTDSNGTIIYQVNPSPVTQASYVLTPANGTATAPGVWGFTLNASP
jgi:hypothetical protein